MSDFKRLRVWKKAHALTLNVDRLAGSIRGVRYAGLRSQMTRAAMSISTNIVEGREQKAEKGFARFLGYSLGSASELEHHLIVARDIQAISEPDFTTTVDQVIDVRKMLHGLIAKLEETNPTPPKQSVSS
jgi:four helix bundle protein